MVAMNFSTSGLQIRYGSDGGGLPAGKHKVIIEKSELVPTRDNSGNGYLRFDLKCVEGLAQGGMQTDRLNVHHSNPQTVAIAQGQLAAYCAVVGKMGFGDTSELHNIPFYIEVGPQRNNPEYTEVKKLFDLQGNEPGKAANGNQPMQQAPQQQAPAGFGPAGGQAPQAGGFAPGWSAPQQQFQPQPAPQPEQPQQAWGQQQPAPAQQFQPQAQPAAGPAPWQPSNTGANAPSWGAR